MRPGSSATRSPSASDDPAVGQKVALVVTGVGGELAAEDVIGALRRELPLYMVPGNGGRARRDTPFAEREVRPNAPSRAARTMSAHPTISAFGVAG